jgi:xanthine dehydrogenase accessory factor
MIGHIAVAPSDDSDSAFDWPDFGLQDDVRPALAQAMAAGQPAVLATLYHVIGGAPRGVGAQMLFSGGAMSGFLSGGCVEADVAVHARAVIGDGAPRRIVYGDGGPADIALACGSRIDLLLEPIAPDDVAVRRLLDLTAARTPAVWLSDGVVRACIAAPWTAEDLDGLPKALVAAAAHTTTLDAGEAAPKPFAIARPYAPPLRLLILGGDPIALAVVRLAADMGIETVLLRPKGPQKAPLPTVRYRRDSLQACLDEDAADPWTAIAILTHDADQEHEALAAALNTDAGYVGALGSRRRIADRNARLAAAGLSPAAIARVRAPIGLAIGGKSPWEIAVSIIAEIMAATPADHRNKQWLEKI